MTTIPMETDRDFIVRHLTRRLLDEGYVIVMVPPQATGRMNNSLKSELSQMLASGSELDLPEIESARVEAIAEKWRWTEYPAIKELPKRSKSCGDLPHAVHKESFPGTVIDGWGETHSTAYPEGVPYHSQGISEFASPSYRVTTVAGSSNGAEHRIDIPAGYGNPYGTDGGTFARSERFVVLDVSHGKAVFDAGFNNSILGMTGQALLPLVSSTSSSGSAFPRIFAAAAGIGFLGSFLANYVPEKPKRAKILAKIGAIGAACAGNVAMASYLLDPKWKLDGVVAAALCLICAFVVARS